MQLRAIEQALQRSISMLRVHHCGRRSSPSPRVSADTSSSISPQPSSHAQRTRLSLDSQRSASGELATMEGSDGAEATMLIELVGKDEPGRLARVSQLIAEQVTLRAR